MVGVHVWCIIEYNVNKLITNKQTDTVPSIVYNRDLVCITDLHVLVFLDNKTYLYLYIKSMPLLALTLVNTD
jgi:hypothetical protein